jgi:23S rRNA pseudouridine2605 synthase
LTAEQLEASRAERMRLNGNGALTLEDARTWMEETGLCLFLPRRQFSAGVAPSFVEAIAGHRNPTPDPKQIALAEELLVRLEIEGIAVRLNLLGQPGEQPDFVVAAWVLPYVYALRGDRDWRRSPQLTGSRQVSPLAIQTYKLLEAGDATIPQLKHSLGKEVTEMAVLRAITELWQQLRIIPVISAPGKPAQWQLLRHRFQKAIAEGASTSQVTAISVLASIYLQAVIAASMEEVELFLAPLTARSKVREVLRGLVATRQVHTLSFGHAPHFYVAGTLPEFTAAPTVYASSAMAASHYFAYARDFEDDSAEVAKPAPAPASTPIETPAVARSSSESHAQRVSAPRKPASAAKPASVRPHFSRPAAHARDRKPAQPSSSSRPARRPSRDARGASSLRHSTNGARWNANGNGNGKHEAVRSGSTNGHGNRPVNGMPATHNGKASAAARAERNGKPTAKAGVAAHSGSHRKDMRVDARSSRNGRKPALTAGAKAGNSKRYGFTAPSKRGTKKRG